LAISLMAFGLALVIVAIIFLIIGFSPFTKVPIVSLVLLVVGVVSLIAGLLTMPRD
jgi:succinate-acetate transporter protein